jgi:HD-GYP domain-containing protein (c-di-GMP phosphodiesterase class II)
VGAARRPEDGHAGRAAVSSGSRRVAATRWQDRRARRHSKKSEERAIINRHPEYSWSILRLFPGLEEASLYALHHHESMDGSGYPAGLKGNDIPLVSRIISVIDAFDAMVSNRCYRQGLPHAEAIGRLLRSSGTQFDPDVLRLFIPIAEQEAEDVFAAAGTSMAAAL